MRYKRHKIKITRKALKRDSFLEFAGRTAELFSRYKLRIIASAALAAIVAVCLFLYGIYREKSKSGAFDALAEAKDVESLVEVSKKYSGLSAGGFALYMAANQYYRDGQKQKSMELFKDFLKSYPLSRLIPNAMLAVGYIEEDNGNYDEAINVLNGIVKQFPLNYVCPEALMFKAGLLEKNGKIHEAVSEYRNLVKSYPASLWSREAEAKIFVLETNI
ncbi:MAG: tetratricopeptide repeat protein [Candidatus Aureabacteria bacterium]|nr:tetratricopeptide repeat protein [Candidatus Auribacterota bacterium]